MNFKNYQNLSLIDTEKLKESFEEKNFRIKEEYEERDKFVLYFIDKTYEVELMFFKIFDSVLLTVSANDDDSLSISSSSWDFDEFPTNQDILCLVNDYCSRLQQKMKEA